MKLQTKVTTQVAQEIEIDIELPYYFRRSLIPEEVIMIESQQRIVSAYTGLHYTSIYSKPFNADVAKELQVGTQCTAEEFYKAYETALANIQNLQEA